MKKVSFLVSTLAFLFAADQYDAPRSCPNLKPTPSSFNAEAKPYLPAAWSFEKKVVWLTNYPEVLKQFKLRAAAQQHEVDSDEEGSAVITRKRFGTKMLPRHSEP